ncbi:MAG: arsenate reductase ArsC [Pseudolabrys sp.]|nr:arsenate reductase ArsC [Pseudolabrys sp.]
MRDRAFTVLFLCTGNSARSVLAESILNRSGAGKFQAFSAGSQPKGEVHPQTLALLSSLGHDISALRSKTWAEFAAPGAAPIDFIFTVCDNAAGETCPIWPGKPMTAHWGISDPAAADGTGAEIALAFKEAYRMLGRRIDLFVALPFEKLDSMTMQSRLRDIGRLDQAVASP